MFLAMIVYVCLVLIRPQDYPQWEESLGAMPLLPAALAVATVSWVLSREKKYLDAPQLLLLLAFFVLLLVSQVVNGWVGGIVLILGAFLPVACVFVFMLSSIDSRERLQTMMAVMTLCSAIMSLHGIEQASIGIGWTGIELSQGTRIQYVGLFNDPNDLGMLFIMSLPMAIYLAYCGSTFSLRRLFWLVVAGILVYGVYLTDSRGTLLALIAVIGMYFWRRWGIVPSAVLGTVCLIGLMVLLPSRLQELNASEESAMGRVEAWYAGIQMFVESPLFGVGAGGFTDRNALTAHNSFVLILAETGAIGFTIWIALIGYCFLMMLAMVRKGDEYVYEMSAVEADASVEDEMVSDWGEDRRIASTLLTSMVGFFVCAFFLSRSYIVVLYMLLAMATAHYMRSRERWPFLPEYRLGRDVLFWPMLAGGFAVFLYLAVKVLLATS